MTTITVTALDLTRLIVAALTGLVVLLLLIIKLEIQVMIFILIDAVAIGLVADMPSGDIINFVSEGIGSIPKGIALLVGLGSMFDSILEISGGAQTLAATTVKKFSDKKVAWALEVAGLVIAMPVFFDAGLITLILLALSLAKRTERSSLFYAIPLLAGLVVGHVSILPTSGPMLMAIMLGVGLGWVIMVGIICGIFTMIAAGPIRGAICRNKYDIPVPEYITNQEDFDESEPLKFGIIVGVILILLVLIILNSIAKVMPAFVSVQPALEFLGEPFVALTIAMAVIMVPLGYRYGHNNEELKKVLAKSLEPIGLTLLMTACGGVFRFMPRNSGLGDVIGNTVSSTSPPIVAAVFVVTALARISAGSAAVAMIMAADIIAAMSEIATTFPLYLARITATVAGGVAACSHLNDSGFWLVRSLAGLDKKTTLKIWVIMETLVGGTRFVVAFIIFFFTQG